jgi:hypothetical protein
MIDKFIEIKYDISQSSLKVRFVRNAKRHKKNQIFLHSKWTYNLWRNDSFSSILQIFKIETPSSELCPMASLQPKKYYPSDLFLAHLFAIVAGIGRI